MSFFSRRHWAIHNPLKSWTLAGLSLRECQVLVASMSDADMKISWVYHKDWTDWKPIGDELCHSLFKLKEKDNFHLPSLPLMNADDRDHDITQVRTSTSFPSKFKEPVVRKFVRYSARLPVEIIVGSHSFNTFTEDLSEGGFLFADPLPEWVAGYFTVSVQIADQIFELTCFLAEDQKKEKFRTEISPTNSDELLQKFHQFLIEQKYPLVSA